MATEGLSFEQRKINFKWYWKFEYLREVQKQWWREPAMEPPSQLTTGRIRENSEAAGTVHDVTKQGSGRPCTATCPASPASTCFGYSFYLPLISSMGMSHFTFNNMAHHNATIETSESISIKAYEVNGHEEEAVLSIAHASLI
jgi:hypothetical protein